MHLYKSFFCKEPLFLDFLAEKQVLNCHLRLATEVKIPFLQFVNIYLRGFFALRPVFTTSVEKSILCLFYFFFFALASILTTRFNRRSIKETKNALFHARSGNGPLDIFVCYRYFEFRS